MTRAEWDALSAKERDAIVAEKVMGWRFVSDHAELAAINGHNGDPERWHMTGEWHSERGREACVECGNLPDFTTSPDGMMAVVEKMKDERRQVGIHWENGESAAWWGTFWECEISKPYDYKTAYRATHATSAPEAVCLAALMALGHMEGK